MLARSSPMQRGDWRALMPELKLEVRDDTIVIVVNRVDTAWCSSTYETMLLISLIVAGLENRDA